jgi:segregation and condensation protein B
MRYKSPMSLDARIEALIFASDRPLSIEAILRIFAGDEGVDRETVKRSLANLVEKHDKRMGGFHLAQVAGGYEFRTREDFAGDILRLYNRRPDSLSKPAMEVLAIVAFRQPVTRALVEEIRGVDSSGILRTLLSRELIAIAGRARLPGRPHLYKSTPNFLRVFGLSTLRDLPTPREMREMSEEHVLRLDDYRRQGELEIRDANNQNQNQTMSEDDE